MRELSLSILAANFGNLEKDIKNVEEYTDYIHIDIMDGNFVPNISFGADITKDISNIVHKPLDIHLMIKQPLKYIDKFLELNPEYITVHYEAVNNNSFDKIVKKINEKNEQNAKTGINRKIKLGLAISPDTPYEVVIQYIDTIDLILVMTVYPGFYGQTFIEDMIYKVDTLKDLIKENNYNIKLEVDGGVNNETITKLENADIIVVSSYIFKSKTPSDTIKMLRKKLYI